MKKIKIISVFLAVLIIFAAAAPAVYAVNNDAEYYEGLLNGVIDTEKFKEIFGGLINGGGNNDSVRLGNLSQILEILKARFGNSYNIDQILDALKQVLGDDFDLSKILSGGVDINKLLNGDVIAKIKSILSGETTTVPVTTEPKTEPETEAPTEATTQAPAAPATEAPATTPYHPSRSDPAQYTVPATTEESTTFSYIPPERVTVPVLSNESTTYNVYDDTNTGDGSVTVKMVIGIIILVLSGVAVAVVAVILKKSRV